jgi:hypothetical protein
MESIRVKQLAEELGITTEYALRLAKKSGCEIHYGKRNAAFLTRADADKIISDYQPRRTSKDNTDENSEFDGFGYYYVIQLLPQELPDRIKIGFTDSIDQRLADHRTTNPTLKLVKAWPCKRTWEHAATASITRAECKKIGGEVYEGKAEGFVGRAEAFFALMPNQD